MQLDRSPLGVAVQSGRLDVVEYLFEHGATATSDELVCDSVSSAVT